jgi:ATP-dependent helicase/nuclease subunit A
VDTLYRLAQTACQLQSDATDAAKNGRGRKRRQPLYLALPDLLASPDLSPAEADSLARFLEVIEALRLQEDRLPVGHLLERLISRTHYDARLLCRPGGRRRLANVRKLLQMANAEPVMGVRDFIRRLRELEKLSDREGDAPTEEEAADVVRILTMHSAKGLEFPVVILADLSRGLLRPEEGLFTCMGPQLALGARLGGEPDLVYRTADKLRQEADKQEAARLLYVAMTRAREHLILCGNVGRNRGFNWADSLFALLGINAVGPEPEQRALVGGLSALVAPLAHYAHAPQGDASGPAGMLRSQIEQEMDRLAEAIAQNEPLHIHF